MKQQQPIRFRQTKFFCFAVTSTAILLLVVLFGANRIRRSVFYKQNEPVAAARIDCFLSIPIDGRNFLIHADVNARGEQTDDYICETMGFVSNYFSVLEWPENRPVEFKETDDEIIITWPLSPELDALNAYKPDYTARAHVDKKTKEVRFYLGS